MELDTEKLTAALKDPQQKLALDAFIAENNMKVTSAEILAIIKAVCQATEIICPLFGD